MTSSNRPGTPELIDLLPAFPLSGTILLPRMRLPLNIFETHLMTMIDDAMAKGRMIGMIQPNHQGEAQQKQSWYTVGCAGRIVHFSETDDNRYLITLLGVCRFTVKNECTNADRPYRSIAPDWQRFLGDAGMPETQGINRARLMDALRPYFKMTNVAADWSIVQNTSDDDLVSSLAMTCPLAPNEKQALLEAETLAARAELLTSLLEMATLHQDTGDKARH